MNKSDQSYTVTPDTAATLRVDLTDAAAARGDVACASHIGLRHETNQDAAALGIDGSGHHIVLVVADGVSSTEGAEECARVASHTARDYLTATMDQGLPINDAGAVRRKRTLKARRPGWASKETESLDLGGTSTAARSHAQLASADAVSSPTPPPALPNGLSLLEAPTWSARDAR